jgi:hypothetical protein
MVKHVAAADVDGSTVFIIILLLLHAVAQLVEAPCYKLEGRGLNS